MDEKSYSVEALKFIADWAKWLITIEFSAIAAVGAGIVGGSSLRIAKIVSTFAVASFFVSIAAAALLLLTLPEIAQNVKPDTNIWLTRDSVIGWLFGMNTQAIAVVECLFFGIGVSMVVVLVILRVWSRSPVEDGVFGL
jgi:hypothetical protein